MGRANVVSNGYTIRPLVESIQHEDVIIGTTTRLYSGALYRIVRRVVHRIQYEHDNLTEAELATWLAAHPLNVAFSHTDELNVTRTMVVVSREYEAVEQPTSSFRTYRMSVELEEA